MSNKKKRKKINKQNKKKTNKIVDNIINNGLIILTIVSVLYSSIVIIIGDNKKQIWNNHLMEYTYMPIIEVSEIGTNLYKNFKQINASDIINNNANKKSIDNSLKLVLGFIYAQNNDLLHSEDTILEDDTYQYTGNYILEDELLEYIDNMIISNLTIMEDVNLDNGILKYNALDKRLEYWKDKERGNIIRTSKIYTTCDQDKIYIHEFVAYSNNDLIRIENDDIVYPNSYSSKNYNLGLYINDENISRLIDKVDLDEYLYTFKKVGDNYYLEKINRS